MTTKHASLATVTVTFNPSLPELVAQLSALPEDCIKIIVDNASSAEKFSAIENIANQIQGTHLIRNEVNLGLAAAINLGVHWLTTSKPERDFVLLLDQDSKPESGSISQLLDAFQRLTKEGRKVGCVGPLLLDPHTGLTHGFHQNTHLRWTRAYPPINSATPIRCTNLNGSGTLVTTSLFQHLGGLDESLFIDHVDTEWAFRVMAHGFELWGIPSAVFTHSMGQDSMRIWLLGWRIWPIRSPQRHYYLYRNAIILAQRTYVPIVWKAWAIIKLALTTSITAITGPSRREQMLHMYRGVKDGILK